MYVRNSKAYRKNSQGAQKGISFQANLLKYTYLT